MKKFLIIIVILIILAVGVLGLALLNANKLIAQFKPQLESTVSELVGAQIELKDVSATVLPETALKVSGLTIKNKSGKAEAEPGPAFDEFFLSLKLKSLLAGKLDITKISLVDPKLTLIKNASGVRLQGLPVHPTSQDRKPNIKSGPEEVKPESPAASLKTPLPINLQSFELKNGTIILEDQVANKSYTVSNLNIAADLNISGNEVTTSNLEVSGKALDKFAFGLNAPKIVLAGRNLSIERYYANLADIAIQGATKLNLNSMSGDCSVSSSGIEMEKVVPLAADFAPAVNQLMLTGTLTPNLNIKLKGAKSMLAEGTIALSKIGLQQGIFNVSDLDGTIIVKAQGPKDLHATSEDLKLNLNNQTIALKFLAKLLNTNLTLENFAVSLLGGSINGSAALGLDDSKAFSSRIQASAISLEKAMELIRAESTQLSGTVENLNASVTGNLGSNLKESLRGNANFNLSNGELKGWNLPGIVLKAVNNLPFLTEALYSSVPDSQRPALDSNSTAFNSITGSITFIEAGINADTIKLIAPIFSLDADGKVGFDSSLDLTSTIFFNQNFSNSLVGKVPQLKNVLDEQGQLVVPLKLQGKPPLILAYPNVKKLVEVAGKKVIVDQAGEAVKGILEKKGLGGVGGLLGF